MISKGLDYSVLAIFGPQSSGKSTLLNQLFSTEFPTLDSRGGRHQVTLGVYTSKAKEDDILVFDMEGTDSKERGGQNNMGFERKISLFALSMAEVLIVNLWFLDIGRYHASNYALLKTVFELHLQLFAKTSNTKTLLLFIIRDYKLDSDFETIKGQILGDIEQIWNTLMKPDEYKSSTPRNFFDFDFVALPH
jgi:GTPase Era involved in 16S rRNA processing